MTSMNLNFQVVGTGTKIQDVKVDPRLRVRVNTGLPFVNFVLSGDAPISGLLPGGVTFFTGTPGAGKSTMSLQLCSALAEQGHTVLFNGNEESPAQVKMTYERLGLKGNFTICNSVFMETPTGPKELIEKVGDNTVMNNLETLRMEHEASEGRKKFENRKHMVVVIDSLQTLNDGKWGYKTNKQTPNRCLEMLCNWAKEHYVHVIVIGQVGKGGEFKGDNVIKHMVDTHIHLYVDEDAKSDTAGMRLLECQKNRFGPSGITVVLDIQANGLREMGGGFRGMRV